MQPSSIVNVRHVRLFKNGRSQAVRIPRDFELQGDEVLMHREGNRLIIEPIFSKPIAQLFASWQPLKDGLPIIIDSAPEDVDL